MATVTGKVYSVTFCPDSHRGSSLVLGLFSGDDESTPDDNGVLLPNDPKTDITVDGVRVYYHDLMAWLVRNRCSVTLWPLESKNGAAVKAKFVGRRD